MAEAGRRYQRRFRGAQKHSLRQASYLVLSKEKVTHQGSAEPRESGTLERETAQSSTEFEKKVIETNLERLLCSGCGQFCGAFGRLDFIGRERPMPLDRGTYDNFKRHRSRDPAALPR